MELTTEEIFIRAVKFRHRNWETVPWQPWHDAEKAEKAKLLAMVDIETATAGEIDDILERKRWRYFLCDDCDQFARTGLYLGEPIVNAGARWLWICAACITKAYNLLPLEDQTDAPNCDMSPEEMAAVRALRKTPSQKPPVRFRLKQCLSGLLKMLRNR